MPQIEVSKTVHAPASRVWDIMTDLNRAPDVVSGIETVEVLDGGDTFGVGTRWRETRTMFGRQATEEMEVTAMDAGRSYSVEAESHGSHYFSTFSVTDLGKETSQLTMTFAAEGTTTLNKLMTNTIGRLFMGPTKKAMAKDLDDIAAAAEDKGV